MLKLTVKNILFAEISYVEHGRNPDIFTQSFVERTATENQYTNGKVKAVDVNMIIRWWKPMIDNTFL